MPTPPDAPLFRDPLYDGAADPVLVWNRAEATWWIVYTNRRATLGGPGVSWVHGTHLGIAASSDGGQHWAYRGVIDGLDIDEGLNTFWAPEILWHAGRYHMYVSYIKGVHDEWSGPAKILHYTSPDLTRWAYESAIPLDSNRVIDPCVHPRPDGGFRMWYKDERRGSHTCFADSDDLYHWTVRGEAITHRPHEGPNVFELGGKYWMLVDEWRGQGVFHSTNLEDWEYQGRILDTPGHRADDGTIALHADVVCQGDTAYIFYFTHPDRGPGGDDGSYSSRRSSLQVASARIGADGTLTCDRNGRLDIHLEPPENQLS